MDLSYTDEEEQFRAELRGWLQDNIPERWTRPGFWTGLDPDQSFTLRRDWERDKAKAGFAGIAWPKEYGGRGGTPGMKAIYDEEMVRARAPQTVNGLGLRSSPRP
jgi:alkylation response protein AidB-like acyl-CoA dehydrogenase